MIRQKKPIIISDVNVDNIVVSKLIETRDNSNYLFEYLDQVIRPLVLVLPQMSGYVKSFKHKDDDKDKNKNKKLISSCIDDDKLSKNIKPFGLRLETYKALNECFTSL